MPTHSQNWLRRLPAEAPDFGLYVHWPFCAAKCPYCDFNSHVWGSVDQTRWRDALLEEIKREAGRTPDHVLGTIFFGGGTPSLMPPDTVGDIIGAARKAWRTRNDLEVTLEANPNSAEASKFRALHDAGVTRVSVGVQASNDVDLKALGRLHSVEEAWEAVALSQKVFNRSSFDLIYARQNQTLEAWQGELREALDRSAGHLSLYQLTIEPGTAFGDRFSRGRLRGLPDDDTSADMYLLTQDLCENFGLPAYEVSNHAQNGQEARHNLLYWQGGDYAGIGPGAHGRLTQGGLRQATEAIRDPTKWLAAVETTGSGDQKTVALTEAEVSVEALMMGLRLSTGLSSQRFAALSGTVINHEALKEMTDLGLLVQDNAGLRLTKSGQPLVNAILNKLLF